MEQVEQIEKPIITYSIGYSNQHYTRCTQCKKAILQRTLRVGTIIRENKKEKKKLAKHQWCHFNCWKVPHELTIRPVEYLSGYRDLKMRDRKKVKDLISSGTGANWKIVRQELKAIKQRKNEANKQGNHIHYNDDDDDRNEDYYTAEEDEDKMKENTNNKKENLTMEVEYEDYDMTTKLTGIQISPAKKISKNKQRHKEKMLRKQHLQKYRSEQLKEECKNDTLNQYDNQNKKVNNNQSKVQQKHLQKKAPVKLSNPKDQLQLEAITKEIRSTLSK